MSEVNQTPTTPPAPAHLESAMRKLRDNDAPDGALTVQLNHLQAAALLDELRRLRAVETEVNTPHTAEFLQAVQLEAAHQRQRWAAEHDAGKTDADWFWLVGYLTGKVLHKPEKRLHHIITTAAALLNWHAAKTGNDTRMRPGIDAPAAEGE